VFVLYCIVVFVLLCLFLFCFVIFCFPLFCIVLFCFVLFFYCRNERLQIEVVRVGIGTRALVCSSHTLSLTLVHCNFPVCWFCLSSEDGEKCAKYCLRRLFFTLFSCVCAKGLVWLFWLIDLKGADMNYIHKKLYIYILYLVPAPKISLTLKLFRYILVFAILNRKNEPIYQHPMLKCDYSILLVTPVALCMWHGVYVAFLFVSKWRTWMC